MTQWEDYLEYIKPFRDGSRKMLSVMRETLEQIGNHSEMGYEFLFEVMKDLASEASWEFGEAVNSTFLEDIPPHTTATFLSEIFCLPFEESKVGKLLDPMTFLFDPIFGVDFPQIYGSLFSNLLLKIEEKDPSIIEKVVKKIRERKLVLTH